MIDIVKLAKVILTNHAKMRISQRTNLAMDEAQKLIDNLERSGSIRRLSNDAAEMILPVGTGYSAVLKPMGKKNWIVKTVLPSGAIPRERRRM